MSKAEKLSGFDFARLADVRALKPGLLYPYQSDGVAFLLSKKRAVLGDDMGLGKTRQAIVSMQMGAPEGKILVVCPAALKLNWRREILLVDPDAAVEVIGSTIPAAEDPRWRTTRTGFSRWSASGRIGTLKSSSRPCTSRECRAAAARSGVFWSVTTSASEKSLRAAGNSN